MTQLNRTIAPSLPSLICPRRVEQLVAGEPTSDGAGVKLNRVLTQSMQRRLDPFLMLDAFRSDHPGDYLAGFPDHPHRGFETVTFMIAGRMRHRDSVGNAGLLESGAVQWMTAGRGVIHSEMPEQRDGLMEGFQLWLNLPASQKMCAPWYRDFTEADLPSFQTPEGVRVVVIAGASHGVEGAVQREGTQPLYLDIQMPAGTQFEQPLPASRNAFVYVYRGAVEVGGSVVPCARMAVLAHDATADGVRVSATEAARLLLIAGEPLREPIVQYGPFVMNTTDQIRQTLLDFQAGRIGA